MGAWKNICMDFMSDSLNEGRRFRTLNIIDDHNWSTIAFVDYAQERGVKVKLWATLFGSNELSTLLSSQSNRQNAINNLLLRVLERGADGIDIDFELLPSTQRSNLSAVAQPKQLMAPIGDLNSKHVSAARELSGFLSRSKRSTLLSHSSRPTALIAITSRPSLSSRAQLGSDSQGLA